ncbi:hypothetical protein GCM10009786_23770 [Leucobacter alluvii]|uniref:Uncharacterized protein n=1 Tax=Leucobacter alluvii TaxID=340321 RepID=A0ABN3B7K1_9MICO
MLAGPPTPPPSDWEHAAAEVSCTSLEDWPLENLGSRPYAKTRPILHSFQRFVPLAARLARRARETAYPR